MFVYYSIINNTYYYYDYYKCEVCRILQTKNAETSKIPYNAKMHKQEISGKWVDPFKNT